MKIKIIFFCSFIFYSSCFKEKNCPESITLSNYELESKTLEWNPYRNHSEVIFIDAEGEEYIFNILVSGSLTQHELFERCEENDNQLTTYKYTSTSQGSLLELKSGNLDFFNFGPIGISITPELHKENPDQELIGDFLSVSHYIAPLGFSLGNTIEFLVNQRSFPSIIETNDIQLLDEYFSNGTTYKNVITNQYIDFGQIIITTSLRETIFGDLKLYYNNQIGIIEMEYSNGKKLFFKEFR